MNRSKLIGATALATVMTAGAANAAMSVSGLAAGKLTDAGNGLGQSFSTNSVYVTYSDSLDNGMGISVGMSIYSTNILTGVNIDTGMGVIGLGNNQDSAADKMDGSPACYSLNACGAAELGGYDDGDSNAAGNSGNSIAYSNSMGGLSFKVTRGMESGLVDPIMSYAGSMSIMGATVKAGVTSIDYKAQGTADKDPSFVTVGYSLAGLNLGYAMYDGDDGNEETQMGVGTSMGGYNMGIQFASLDATTDKDQMEVSISKGMGAASFGLDYTEIDEAGGTANDTEGWRFMYVIGF
jgi:hypothetical protein